MIHENLLTMREAGKKASYILRKLKKFIKPGITTKDIESFFDRTLEKFIGMEPAFKGFKGYPSSLCVSVNEEIIHGIPSNRIIREGDIVSVDLGIKYNGTFVDTAYTYLMGRVSELARRLVKTTHLALYEGIKKSLTGTNVGTIGGAVQDFVEKNGFSVIRKFVGHGIGKELHTNPEIPNFGKKGQGEKLSEGCAIAIEPMVCTGDYNVEILNDGWTAKTKDNSLSAHFEHTIAITAKGPWILTA